MSVFVKLNKANLKTTSGLDIPATNVIVVGSPTVTPDRDDDTKLTLRVKIDYYASMVVTTWKEV